MIMLEKYRSVPAHYPASCPGIVAKVRYPVWPGMLVRGTPVTNFASFPSSNLESFLSSSSPSSLSSSFLFLDARGSRPGSNTGRVIFLT